MPKTLGSFDLLVVSFRYFQQLINYLFTLIDILYIHEIATIISQYFLYILLLIIQKLGILFSHIHFEILFQFHILDSFFDNNGFQSFNLHGCNIIESIKPCLIFLYCRAQKNLMPSSLILDLFFKFLQRKPELCGISLDIRIGPSRVCEPFLHQSLDFQTWYNKLIFVQFWLWLAVLDSFY